MFIVVHISTVITWLCMPEMSVLKGWKYGKRSSQCSSGNNNNVNAFLTCTTQEARCSVHIIAALIYSPRFPPSRWYLEPPPCLLSTVSFRSVPPLPICTRCSMQGEKARSFSTREHDELDGGTRRRNETDTEEDGFARAEENAMSLLCIAQSLVSIEV